MMINLVKKELPIFTLVYTYMNDEHNACPLIFWNVRTENQQSMGSMAWCDGVVTFAGGEAASGRGKGGDNIGWADVNLTGPKNEENSRGRFNCYNWTVKI
jgi:hypothetical protein